jgi:hypothetical protein
VKALTRAGRFDRAKRVIEETRTRDRTASMFMDTEFKVILERLRGGRTS